MVSCQKGPTRHAYAWQIGPFWQDTLDIAKYASRGMHDIPIVTHKLIAINRVPHLCAINEIVYYQAMWLVTKRQ